MFAKNLDSRGIRCEVSFDGVTVDYVLGDELRISQIIINFLSNAVKFTSEGEIIVTFRQVMLRNGVADIMIRVHDTASVWSRRLSVVFSVRSSRRRGDLSEIRRHGSRHGHHRPACQAVGRRYRGGEPAKPDTSNTPGEPSAPGNNKPSKPGGGSSDNTNAAARLPRHQYRADLLRIPCRIRIPERPAQALLASRIRAASRIMKEMWMTAPYRGCYSAAAE